jgi:hypothetical protein
MEKIILAGSTFKQLVTALCKFPAVGNFVGADQLHVEAHSGKLTAMSVGAVLARTRVDCEGELALVGIERRAVESFAQICTDSKVVIAVEGEITLTSRGREIKIARAEGQKYPVPSLKDQEPIKLTEDVARRMAYLSEVAFGDSSRPELCCVLLAGKDAIACNQRTVAVFRAGDKLEKVAVPLLLAKTVVPNDLLYPGSRETVLRSGASTYSMSTPVQAQKSYPLDAIRALGKGARKAVLTVAGEKLAAAIQECSTCIGGLSKTETVLNLFMQDKKLWMASEGGGAHFKTPIPVLSVTDDAVTFRAPLDGMLYIAPFLQGGPVGLAQGSHGDMIMEMESGWVLYPAWSDKTKKAKK